MSRASKLLVAGALLSSLVVVAYGVDVFALRPGAGGAAAARVCPHTLAPERCPFCTPARLETEGWCAGHGVPEAVCTRCHAELVAAFQAQGDWCAEHGLPESQCVACDPARATAPPTGPAGATCKHGAARAVCFVCDPALVERRGQCTEHGVPEALCTRCDPALIPVFQATYDWCAEHDLPESQCVLCNPRAAAASSPPPAPLSPAERRQAAPTVGCRLHEQRIRLASGRVAREVGIETAAVSRGPLRDRVAVTAELAYAADRHAELSPRAAGTVAELRVGLGDPVEAGAVLAWIDAPELGAARAAALNAARLLEAAERTHARELELVAGGVGTQRAVIEADTRRVQAAAALLEAEQRLSALGLSPGEVEAARAAAPATPPRLALRAPFSGVVTALDVAPGEAVAPGRPLLSVADTRTLWALLDIPEGAIARVALEQPVVISVAALPGERFTGRISWISSAIDRRTRTLKVRAELANPQGRLRAHMFGTADVLLSDRRDALLVPAAAVQWEGCCHVVFLPSGVGAYVPHKVRLGGAAGAHVEVLAGLDEGDHVVTTGAFLLKTELLKGSIGAGCCEPAE